MIGAEFKWVYSFISLCIVPCPGASNIFLPGGFYLYRPYHSRQMKITHLDSAILSIALHSSALHGYLNYEIDLVMSTAFYRSQKSNEYINNINNTNNSNLK